MRDSQLIAMLETAFETAGGRVLLSDDAGNTVRSRRDGEPASPPLVVEAQGLPNLLHEFVHYALRGSLEIDHGYDYALIPFDTVKPEQRAWLWEELSCCVVSCAYLAHEESRVLPWFEEQVGIQHHFFGFEKSGAFLDSVDELMRVHASEARVMESRAYAACERLLSTVSHRHSARPARRLSVGTLWPALRNGPAARGSAERAKRAKRPSIDTRA